ncbi:DUF4886 domain-containing protein [uncultured Alistipes sp.]|uniref:DUF4886 domain-containing protein n=1 Tax=uncultured Alistipes sp. TaxID=538949 RepID=UPI0025CDD263|nr:DUF4886 domain-containing protein [uncultured Alistipes sp.]
MKKILYIIITVAAALLCGCTDYDDSSLRNRIDGYKERIEALKQKADQLNKEISDLSHLTNGNVITSVGQDADGKYVITYRDNKDVVHTVVLATMSDIIDVPIVGVKADEDGVYYWTKYIDGETSWLTDDEGNKFPVSGYTPTIAVDEDGYWTIDGERVNDSSGNPIQATTDATSVFRSAGLDEEGNFSLTLGDGTTVTLRVFNSLNLKLDAVPVTTVADPSRSIKVQYELSGEAKDKAIVALAKAEGLEALLDRAEKTITVSFDASFSRGTLIVMAYDLSDNVIVKPLFYKAATLGTIAISTADELVAFAAAVNAGGEEATGKAILTGDIDMSGVSAWTPIGNGTFNTSNVLSGAAFGGTFDGQGHAVKNLKIKVPADAASGSAWGLFGVLNGATVKNVTIGEGSSVVSTAAAMTSVGAVAGYAADALIEQCVNRATFDIAGGADNIREVAGGVVGTICSFETGANVKQCSNFGAFTSRNASNTKNGATGFSIGGVVGFADAHSASTAYNNVVECVNEGAMAVEATRTAGVVATMNKYTKLEGCVNKATVACADVTASNSRVAGIVSAMGGYTYLKQCVNYGEVMFTVPGDTTHGYAAGIAGQTNDNNSAFDGCENYGAVLSDIFNAAANKYIGIICANTNKKSVGISNCKIGGKIGPYSGGAAGATEITADNYEQFIYFSLAGVEPTLENNVFAGGGAAKPGIATAADLGAFRDAVNAGESTAQWEDAGGVVTLLNDIDMSGVTDWTPIGNATYTWASNLLTVTGNAYKGVFDGKGYALKNLKLSYSGSTAGAAYGLFGVLDGATVRNLKIGAASGDQSVLAVTASGGTAEVGVIAGVCRDAHLSNCVNYAKIDYSGTSTARISVAMVGFIYSQEKAATLDNLKNYGKITVDTKGNSGNGAGAAIHAAGICGFATGNTTAKICNVIAYCDNYGDITSTSARSSGIVAAANSYTEINSCVNHGNQLNSCGSTGRLGNITCITGTACTLTDCINNGNLVSTGGGRCGGLVSLVNHATNSFSGCANYGEIITDDANRGVFFGYSAVAANWINCIAGGKVGVYNGGTYAYDSHSEADKQRYLGAQSASNPINADNITYMIGTSSGGPGDGEDTEPTLRILFIGNSFTKDAVEHLPKMVSAAGIETLKMTHLYYGGRTIPEYANGYGTTSDYTCYKYNPGTSLWLSYTGYNIRNVVKSDKWDIVCLQEHTGNSCGWIWDDKEKNAIEGLIAAINADQDDHTPQFVYIMSQAYFNMEKIGTAQRPYKTFTTQSEMFDVIVAQGRKVLAETQVARIIPTGTVLQNLRTSSENNAMDLTRDGYHMDYGLSRYAAACAVFESIISPSFGDVKLDGNTFRYAVSNTTDGSYTTPVTDANQPIALKAARYALATPFEVTNMSPAPGTPGNGIGDIEYEDDPNKE